MRHHPFEDWCHNAVSGILFPPDQRKVYQELYAHLEDRYDILREQGVEPAEAEKQAVAAMGDAWVIAPQLAEIHQPFWGFCLRATRWLLAIILVLTLIPVGKFFWELNWHDPGHRDFDVYDASSYGSDTGRTLLMLTEPDIRFKDSGYTFRVTDAAVWDDGEKAFLYLRMKMSNYSPWALFPDWWTDPMHDLYGKDSLGNYYKSMDQRIDPEQFYVCTSGSQTSPITYEYEIWINDLILENDWIEFVYDRDGRDHCIRIHLPGGEE